MIFTLLIGVFGATAALGFSGYPPKMLLRSSIAWSDIIVVGTVSGTESFDIRKRDRVSTLEVDYFLYGEPGKTVWMRVHWLSDEWHPTATTTSGAADGELQVDHYTDKRSIWLLDIKDGEIWAFQPVIELSKENEKTLYEYRGIIENGFEKDSFSNALEMKGGQPTVAERYKLKLVLDSINRRLRELRDMKK